MSSRGASGRFRLPRLTLIYKTQKEWHLREHGNADLCNENNKLTADVMPTMGSSTASAHDGKGAQQGKSCVAQRLPFFGALPRRLKNSG
jgi:hypothetical protein